MTGMVTQCPKCLTSFRVTEAQLAIASGSVRCGSCLHIFNASSHQFDNTITSTPEQNIENKDALLDDSEPSIEGNNEVLAINEQQEQEQEQENQNILSSTIEQNAFNSIFDDDLQHANDDEKLSSGSSSDISSSDDDSYIEASLISTDNTSDGSNTDPGEDYIKNSFDGTDDDFDIDQLSDNLEDPLVDDEKFNDDIFDDVSLDEENSEFSITDTDFSDSFLDLEISEHEPASVYKELDDTTKDDGEDEEQWALDLLEEAKSEEQDETNAEDDKLHSDFFDELEEETRLDPELLDLLNQRDRLADSPPADEEEFVLGNEPMVAGDRIGHSANHNNHDFIANIEPELVEMAAATDPNRWIKRSWLIAIFLATSTLAGQYLYFNFESIARNSNSRPLLIQACDLLGCSVPGLNDIKRIRSTNLMVRSHPKTPNALVVDAIITNTADFKQSFPDVELLFTDLSGKSVAGRRFVPADYIHGELSGTDIMPSNQPVYISFEIVDPGEKAVNYQILFHAN